MIRLADCFPDMPADALPLKEFDWARSGVALPYVIFITGRCGSTLLTHLLAESGLCGNPDEFFNEERIVDLAREWQTTDFPAYFRAVVRHTVTNRRFGFEVDPFRFQQLRELVSFPDIFPARRTVFFWMTRRDIVSQGWSYAKAKKTGLWHRFADGSEKRMGETQGEPIDDTEWWREIILMLTGERIMEDYSPRRGSRRIGSITRCWSPTGSAPWSESSRRCPAGRTRLPAISARKPTTPSVIATMTGTAR